MSEMSMFDILLILFVFTDYIIFTSSLEVFKEPKHLQNNDISSSNTLAVCGYGTCRGSLWSPQWVITTMDCVKETPVVVYHLHDEDFNCSERTNERKNVENEEKRIADKIYKHRTSTGKNSIAFLHLPAPYTNITHINWLQKGDTFVLETWLQDSFEEYTYNPIQTAAANGSQVRVKSRDLINLKRRVPAFNVFAAVVLLPVSSFLVLYLLVSFFSRKSLLGKDTYEDFYV